MIPLPTRGGVHFVVVRPRACAVCAPDGCGDEATRSTVVSARTNRCRSVRRQSLCGLESDPTPVRSHYCHAVATRADWSRLTAWLSVRHEPVVTMSWAERDRVVGGLPTSATKHYPQWWHGDRPNTRAWVAAGYELDRVDLARSVAFRRAPSNAPQTATRPVTAMPSVPRTASPATDGEVGLSSLAAVDANRALIVLPCRRTRQTAVVPHG
jgi:hypothetical protein